MNEKVALEIENLELKNEIESLRNTIQSMSLQSNKICRNECSNSERRDEKNEYYEYDETSNEIQ